MSGYEGGSIRSRSKGGSDDKESLERTLVLLLRSPDAVFVPSSATTTVFSLPNSTGIRSLLVPFDVSLEMQSG